MGYTIYSRKRMRQIIAMIAATWLFWGTPVIYPVNILVTFFHELSHGLGALLTGGKVIGISVQANGAGLCRTQGGWDLVIGSAGYLGSMFWGSLILLLASRTRYDRAVSVAIGLLLVAVTLLFVRAPFGIVSGLLLGGLFLAVGLRLDESANDLALTFTGASVCLYALYDIRALFVGDYGDAAHLSRDVLPLPPAVWALLWAAVSAVWFWFTLKLALREELP